MKPTLKQDERNYGVDLLRIVAMLMAAVTHVLGRGGVINTVSPFSLNYQIVWILEAAAYCAVNCYGLISGYVGAKKKIKYSSLAYLYLQVLCYTLGITVVYWILRPDSVSRGDWVAAFFPLTKEVYWYFTAYFLMYLFTPVLNTAIQKMSVGQLGVTLTVIGVFLLPESLYTDVFHVDCGFHALWLSYLYLWGGFFSRVNLKKKKGKWLVLYGVMVLVTFVSNIVLKLLEYEMSLILYFYPSPTVFLEAVGLFLFFVNLEVPKWMKGVIRFFAPVSFGVYLIHVHPKLFMLLKFKFEFLGEGNPLVLLFTVLGSAVAIFVVCALVDFVRLKIFDLLKVRPLLVKLENFIRGKNKKLLKKTGVPQ